MKLPLLLGAALVAVSLSACAPEKEVVVVHHTTYVKRPVHHTSNNPDTFQAVEKPASYSQ